MMQRREKQNKISWAERGEAKTGGEKREHGGNKENEQNTKN
jgi:hypothetical protein